MKDLLLINTRRIDKKIVFKGVQETEVNEFMIIGLGLGMVSVVMIAVFLFCHRKQRKRYNKK